MSMRTSDHRPVFALFDVYVALGSHLDSDDGPHVPHADEAKGKKEAASVSRKKSAKVAPEQVIVSFDIYFNNLKVVI